MKRFSRLQTTHPTSGGAVTAVINCCANCVEPYRPQQWGPDIPFAIARTIALEERVMVTPQMSLLDLTIESGIPGDVMRHL